MKIAFLVADPLSLSAEEQAAWDYLRSLRSVGAKRLSFQSIRQNPKRLLDFELVWWHLDSSTSIPEVALEPKTVAGFIAFLKSGRGLLLSLLAAQYVVDLRLESVRPNIVTSGSWEESSWAEGNPDIRGFGGFGAHPLFQGFPGGLYTMAPEKGSHYSSAYYEDQAPNEGKVVSVEKLYIGLNERRRNVIEYAIGSGRILCVGSHLQFVDHNQRFRKHLEAFVANCFSYVTKKKTTTARPKITSKKLLRNYWEFNPATVTEFSHHSKPLELLSSHLPKKQNDLALHRDFAAPDRQEQCFDLSGRRILIMGKERGGVSEVWCHPVRILHGMKVAFMVGDSPLQWSHALTPEVTIRPESLLRRYEVNGAVIDETLFADHLRPAGAIHFRIQSRSDVRIFLTAHIDLRWMWPLSSGATGSLCFSWDKTLHAGIVTSANGSASAILGSSLAPSDYQIGQFSDVLITDGLLKGKRTEASIVALGSTVSLSPSRNSCTFVFAGSGSGLEETLRSYRGVVQDPRASLQKQINHSRSVARSSVLVQTPDSELNSAYQWAVQGIDKLFVETPHLGRSFVAGYGNSSAGWNGGHAISGRPGYAWYFGRDSVWTSFAALDYGDYEKVREVLDFLGRHQDESGKILHEMTTSGYAHYDAADSTPLYLILMGKYIRSSGDRAFARRSFEKILKAVEFCFTTDKDGDHLIENTNVGHGWIEGGKLFPAHAEQYLASCWASALSESAFLARTLKRKSLETKWINEAGRVREILNKDFWNSDTRSYNFAKRKDGTYVEERTVLPTVGMYLGVTDMAQSRTSLEVLAGDEFSSDWGVRIVSRKSHLFNPTGYHYGSIWPLFTGWTALAEFAHERPIQGYLHLMSNGLLHEQFSGGNIEEVLHGDNLRPVGVCPHQGWSQSMVIQPLLEGMLGFRADAMNGVLELRPYLPPHWQNVQISNLRVGNQYFSLGISRTEGRTTYTVHRQSHRGRSFASRSILLRLRPALALGSRIQDVAFGDKRFSSKVDIFDYGAIPVYETRLRQKIAITINHTQGIALIPPVPHLQQESKSQGIRILNESWIDNAYVLNVEGKDGAEYLLDIHDPSHRVELVTGADVLARDAGRIVLAVTFPGEKNSTEYSTKEIRLQT
jgi:glycogen debranching enzyme